MNKIYIGYQGDLPVRIESSREAIENDKFLVCDRIVEHEGRAELVGGKILFDVEIDAARLKELEEKYTSFVQHILDAEAQKLGYDNCNSVCTYVDTGVQKFDDEGRAFRAWRSAVWAKGYELLDAVKAGEMAIPTEEELVEMLPKLVIAYSEGV